MNHSLRLLALSLLFISTNLVVSCTAPRFPKAPAWTFAPLSDTKSVAGLWEGIMTQSPQTRRDDWVRLLIREDGRYEFESYRMIGVLRGNGRFTVTEGKLMTQTDRGRISCVLYTAEGQRMLKAEGVTRDGVEYSAELMPVR